MDLLCSNHLFPLDLQMLFHFHDILCYRLHHKLEQCVQFLYHLLLLHNCLQVLGMLFLLLLQMEVIVHIQFLLILFLYMFQVLLLLLQQPCQLLHKLSLDLHIVLSLPLMSMVLLSKLRNIHLHLFS